MREGEDAGRESILLAACGAGEVLPQNPDLPADVFTACLTTPIKARAGLRSPIRDLYRICEKKCAVLPCFAVTEHELIHALCLILC